MHTPMQRLKTRPQFQAALAGKTLARTAHFALHRTALSQPGLVTALGKADRTATSTAAHTSNSSAPNSALFSQPCVWLGALVPKRWAKRAVTRNTIKRQIYSVSAQFEPQLAAAAHVVRLRSSFDRQQFVSATSDALKTALRAELLDLFGRACAAPNLPDLPNLPTMPTLPTLPTMPIAAKAL